MKEIDRLLNNLKLLCESNLTFYHGTSDIFLPAILKQGLLPPSQTGSESLGDEGISSRDLVYLAVSKSLAKLAALESISNNGGNFLILKVSLPESFANKLFPSPEAQSEGDLAYRGSIPPNHISIESHRRVKETTLPDGRVNRKLGEEF